MSVSYVSGLHRSWVIRVLTVDFFTLPKISKLKKLNRRSFEVDSLTVEAIVRTVCFEGF